MRLKITRNKMKYNRSFTKTWKIKSNKLCLKNWQRITWRISFQSKFRRLMHRSTLLKLHMTSLSWWSQMLRIWLMLTKSCSNLQNMQLPILPPIFSWTRRCSNLRVSIKLVNSQMLGRNQFNRSQTIWMGQMQLSGGLSSHTDHSLAAATSWDNHLVRKRKVQE